MPAKRGPCKSNSSGSSARFFRDGEFRPHVFSGEGGGELAGAAAVEDVDGDFGGDGHACGFELGLHAADGFFAFVGTHMAKRGGHIANRGDSFSVGVLQSIHAGENHQALSLDQNSDFGGEAVVVAEAKFFYGDGIVFVDDGDDGIGGEETFERVASIRAVRLAVDVSVGEQKLRNVQTVRAKRCGVALHEIGLAGGGAGLFAGEIVGPFAETEHAHAGGNRRAAHEHAGMASASERGDLCGEALKLLAIQRAASGSG